MRTGRTIADWLLQPRSKGEERAQEGPSATIDFARIVRDFRGRFDKSSHPPLERDASHRSRCEESGPSVRSD